MSLESPDESLGGSPPPPPPPEPAAESPPVDAAPVAAEPEDALATTEVNGERLVPLSAVRALREELKSRPKAEEYAALKAAYEQAQPYVDFIRSNPSLTQPAAAPPPAPVEPADDPDLVEMGRTLELYDARTGLPDTQRAATLREMIRREAQKIAEAQTAPMRELTQEQQATENVRRVMSEHGLEPQFITEAVGEITKSMPKADAMRLLSDPRVMDVIGLTALGRQAKAGRMPVGRPAAAAPAAPPLYTEPAGGARDTVPMSEGSKRLIRMTGRSEKDWSEAAKRYVPGRANSLE